MKKPRKHNVFEANSHLSFSSEGKKTPKWIAVHTLVNGITLKFLFLI